MGEPAPTPAELPDQPAVSVPAGFISITPEFLDNKFVHTPSPSENRYVHFRPSSNPRFTIDATSTTGDVEHLYACHPSKMHDELFDSQGRRRFAFPLGVAPPGGGGFNINLEDILGGDFFSSFFGGGGRRRRTSRGSDILLRHSIDMRDVYLGAEQEVIVDLPEPCDTCQGTGAKDGKLKTCATCSGQGQVRVRQQVGPFIPVSYTHLTLPTIVGV